MQNKEKPISEPTIECRKNGPYLVKNVDRVIDSDGKHLKKKEQRALCRCGHTKYKPFCDGSHLDVGFDSHNDKSTSDKVHSSPVGSNEAKDTLEPEIVVVSNGPYEVRGGIKLISEENEYQLPGQQYSLCRCGGSQNKPFCDGSHENNGFRDDQLLAIARIQDIKESLTRVSIGKKELVIINRHNEYSVFSGICLHAGALMAQGFIENNFLTCGKHLWRYDLETGKLDGDPSMGLHKLKSRSEGGWLLIERRELESLEDLED